jgi:hypothetical protein
MMIITAILAAFFFFQDFRIALGADVYFEANKMWFGAALMFFGLFWVYLTLLEIWHRWTEKKAVTEQEGVADEMGELKEKYPSAGWVRGETELKTQHEPALDEDSFKAFTFLLGERADTFTLEQEVRSVLNQFMKILERRGISTPRPVEPEFALNAVEAVKHVINPKMQEYWATFLANAADPCFEREKVRLDFIGVLRGMLALDIDILDYIARTPDANEDAYVNRGDTSRLKYIFETFSENKKVVAASLRRLEEKEFINNTLTTRVRYGGGWKFDTEDPKTHWVFNATRITLQGEEFLRAVSPPDKPGND